MSYLIVTYLLIVAVLSGYGVNLWRRLGATRAEIARLNLTMREEQSPVARSGR